MAHGLVTWGTCAAWQRSGAPDPKAWQVGNVDIGTSSASAGRDRARPTTRSRAARGAPHAPPRDREKSSAGTWSHVLPEQSQRPGWPRRRRECGRCMRHEQAQYGVIAVSISRSPWAGLGYDDRSALRRGVRQPTRGRVRNHCLPVENAPAAGRTCPFTAKGRLTRWDTVTLRSEARVSGYLMRQKLQGRDARQGRAMSSSESSPGYEFAEHQDRARAPLAEGV